MADLEILITNKHGQPMLGYDSERNAVVAIPGLVVGQGGTPGSGSDAPTIASYLEGAFAPRLASTAGAEGQEYAVQAGVWVKVGRLVWIGGRVELAARGLFGGELLLKGLPFPVSAAPYVDGVDIGAITISRVTGLTIPPTGVQGLPLADGNAVALLTSESVPLLEGDVSDLFGITFGGAYVTA